MSLSSSITSYVNKVTSKIRAEIKTHNDSTTSHEDIRSEVATKSDKNHNHSYNDLTNKPYIPSKTSDLTNDSNFISTSSTKGLVKNDGTIDTTKYSTFSGSYNDLTNKPSIPTAISDLTNDSNFLLPSQTEGLMKNDGSIDTNEYALSDHIHDNATTSSNGFMSSADKTKLDGIATGANKITVDSSLSSTSTNPVQNKVINTALSGKASTDTATQSANGLMSSTDKTKLDGIATGANKITVDSALSTTSTNPVQNKVINTALGNKVDKVSGKGLSANDFTDDLKTKLDGIATGANKITVDSSLSSLSTNPVQNKVINTALNNKSKVSFTQTKTSGIEIGKINIDGTSTSIYQQDNNTRYSAATTNANGLMSSSDKTKLNGIEDEANKTIVDTALDGTSTNPVQNKVIKETIDTLATKDEIDSITAGDVTLTGYVKQSDIQNNLTSTATNKPLSAAQGKALNTAIGTKTVTVEKLSTATSGYAASYAVKQNGSQVGATINIPKDFLVKSASVKTCSTANNPESGYKVGDKYLDFVVNTDNVDGVADSHLYILVSELVDVYAADGSSIELYNDNGVQKFRVKDGGITTAKIANSAVTSAKIANGTIVNDDVASNAAIAYSKLNGVAPTSHTDSNGAYGKATTGVWGHTKLNSATNSTSTSESATPSAVKSAYDLANQSKTRYDGNYISGVATVTKPYLRLFHIASKEASFSSGHLIFEIIGNNNDRLYAKIRVDLRQNDVTSSTSNSSYTITPLEVYGFDLNQLYFGFIDDHMNKHTYLDIYRRVGSYANFYIKIYDDHLRHGSYNMYTPVANGTESYTNLTEAATTLYNTAYTSISQGGTYSEITNTVPYTNIQANKFVKRGGVSAQFLKADGSVDGTTYVSGAGTGLTKDGASLKHSNSITADTTGNFKKLKYDAQGHITGTAAVAKSDITDLGVADESHTHVLGDITNVATLGANEDLNSYHTVGLYYCSSTNSSSLSNKPYSGNYMTFIENKRVINNNSYVIQTVYIITTYVAGSWYRLYVNGTWSPWKYISGTDNGISPTEHPNLDGLVQDGLYTITAANSLNIDLPYEDKSACFVRVIDYRIKDNPAQFVYPITAGLGDIYYRNAAGANTDGTLNWQPWQKIFTSKNLTKTDLTNLGVADEVHTHTKSEITDFPTSMTPTSHTHGNITDAGAIGSTANKPIITTTSGKLTTGSFGTTENTFCQGNDSRLSDSRTPTSHTDSTGNYGKATTSVYGHTKLSSVTNSTDETLAATPKAVKAAYDLANSKPSLGTTSTTAAAGNHTHSYLPLSGGTLTGAVSSSKNITTTGTVEAATIKKTSGTSSQFLKADGSVDNNTYSTTSHTHTTGDIHDSTNTNIGLNDLLNAKANLSHTHIAGDIPPITFTGDSVNLNNITDPGLYQITDANVTNGSNTPRGQGFGCTLLVISGVYSIVQIAFDYWHKDSTQTSGVLDPAKIYFRKKYKTNDFESWKTIYTNANIPSASTTQKGIVELINDLTTGGTDKALTAEQGKTLNNSISNIKAYKVYINTIADTNSAPNNLSNITITHGSSIYFGCRDQNNNPLIGYVYVDFNSGASFTRYTLASTGWYAFKINNAGSYHIRVYFTDGMNRTVASGMCHVNAT